LERPPRRITEKFEDRDGAKKYKDRDRDRDTEKEFN
jgi:hypothetical protein